MVVVDKLCSFASQMTTSTSLPAGVVTLVWAGMHVLGAGAAGTRCVRMGFDGTISCHRVGVQANRLLLGIRKRALVWCVPMSRRRISSKLEAAHLENEPQQPKRREFHLETPESGEYCEPQLPLNRDKENLFRFGRLGPIKGLSRNF